MKNPGREVYAAMSAFVLVAAIFSGQLISAQNPSGPGTPQQRQKMAVDENASQKIFTGVIVKSGGKLVLSDSLSKTSYQLDDQQKAQGFVNKNVKVTGVLDAATGTILVTAIGLA
jgi:hypothetical protein